MLELLLEILQCNVDTIKLITYGHSYL